MVNNQNKSSYFHALNVEIQLGKNGISKNIVEDIKQRIKKKKILKVKFLKSYPYELSRKEEAEKVAGMCGAELISVRGNVFILGKG